MVQEIEAIIKEAEQLCRCAERLTNQSKFAVRLKNQHPSLKSLYEKQTTK
ncbi:hypothetical protein PHABIO_250 [Pseudomonas phage Phabio]|uniref:Uncharacterized protein n=1 Tax=Pseudomonas phage Phabio TaxID=2006668 RepID=A0A1Y0STR2_9CAUD|nr:hypothetical protein MZD05_gp250 [Pseudomonas phage Phabio]ARV76881.1 hypothetical protein PHABIO_250 [Pseudomonas phage Phabio]